MRKANRLRFRRILEALSQQGTEDRQQKRLSLAEGLQLVRHPSRANPELYQQRKSVLLVLWKAREISRHPELKPFLSDPAPEDFADQVKQSTSFFVALAAIPGGQAFMLKYLKTIPSFLAAATAIQKGALR